MAVGNTVTVGDVMTPTPVTLSSTDSISYAAKVLSDQGISGAPVVKGQHIVGVVSNSDLIDVERRQDGATVDDVMTPIVYAVRAKDTLMVAVRLMVEESIHRVVVVSAEGQLVGIVSSMDVMRALAKGERVQTAMDDPRPLERHADPAGAVDYIDLRELRLES